MLSVKVMSPLRTRFAGTQGAGAGQGLSFSSPRVQVLFSWLAVRAHDAAHDCCQWLAHQVHPMLPKRRACPRRSRPSGSSPSLPWR